MTQEVKNLEKLLKDIPSIARKKLENTRVKANKIGNVDDKLYDFFSSIKLEKEEYLPVVNFLRSFAESTGEKFSLSSMLDLTQEVIASHKNTFLSNSIRAKSATKKNPQYLKPLITVLEDIEKAGKITAKKKEIRKDLVFDLFKIYSERKLLSLDLEKLRQRTHEDVQILENLESKYLLLTDTNDLERLKNESRMFFNNYMLSYGSGPALDNAEKRNLFNGGLSLFIDTASYSETVRRYFNFWNKVSSIPSHALELWINSPKHVSMQSGGTKRNKDERLLKSLGMTSRNISNFDKRFIPVLELLAKDNNICGIEDFLFSLVREQEFDKRGVTECFGTLERVSIYSKKRVEKIRKKIKNYHYSITSAENIKEVRSLTVDTNKRLYQLLSNSEYSQATCDSITDFLLYVVDKSARNKAERLIKNVHSIEFILNQEPELIPKVLKSGKEVFRIEPHFSSIIAETIKKIANKEDREFYFECTLEFLEDYNQREKNKKEKRLENMWEIEEFDKSIKGDVKKIVKKVAETRKERLKKVYPLYLDDFVMEIKDVIKSDPKKTFSFINAVVDYSSPNPLTANASPEVEYPLRFYLGLLISGIKKLVPKIEVSSWEEALTIIDQREKVSNRVGFSEGKFTKYLINRLEAMENAMIPYALHELQGITKNINVNSRNRFVDLEEVILNSVEKRINIFGREDLSNLHKIFYKMYNEESFVYNDSVKSFNILVDTLGRLPAEHRKTAIRKALTLCDTKIGIGDKNGLERRSSLLVSYAKGLEKNVQSLGDKFAQWVERGMQQGGMEKTRAFFEDVHGYFEKEVESVVGGLPLSKINERLLTYAHALTGRDIKIKRFEKAGLFCSFEGDTFFLPGNVNISSNERNNFGVYKALVSYQAAAILFGTYAIDPETLKKDTLRIFEKGLDIGGYFESFDHPEIAREIFNLAEFLRLDCKLRERFPGLRTDLNTLKREVYSPRGENSSGNDLESSLDMLSEYIYLGSLNSKHDAKVEAKCKDIFPILDTLKSAESSVGNTIEAVKKAYSLLEDLIKVNELTKKREHILELNDKEIAVKSRDSVGYLVAEPKIEGTGGNKFRYPEWDSQNATYKNLFVQVIENHYSLINNDYSDKIIQRDERVLKQLRERFETIKPQDHERVKRQISGEVNYDNVVQAKAEMTAQITPSEKLYTREYKINRSVAAMVLSEVSGSTRKFLDLNNPHERLIDIIKQSKIYFCEALEAVGDNYAAAVFSGESEKNVQFYILKDFGKKYDANVKKAIGSLKPMQQNRDGAGIRHATHLLNQQPEKTRLLFYLMEGIPHDFGYEGKQAIEDTRKALIESKSQGCIPVVLAYGKEINGNIRSLANNCIYREVEEPRSVPLLLPNLYSRLT